MDAYSLQDRSNFHPSYPNLNFDTNKYKGDLDNVVINNQPLATVMIPNNYRIERQSLDTNNPHNLESNYQPPHPSTDNLAFDEKTIRAGFFRKVFGILSCMLLVVVGFIGLFLFESHCRQFVQTRSWVFYISIPFFIITFSVVMFWKQSRHVYPYNLISLAIVTFSLSYVTATVSSYYDVTIVFTAMGICVVSCVAVALFSIQTRFDFGSWIGIMYIVVVVFTLDAIVSLICLFAFNKQEATLTSYAGLLAMVIMLFFTSCIVIKAQNLSCRDYEEYISAAILLFVSIISLFLIVLIIVAVVAGSKLSDCNGYVCFCAVCDVCSDSSDSTKTNTTDSTVTNKQQQKPQNEEQREQQH